jgi:anaerobic selenocysteine-containing dehydrogenase
VAIGQYFEAIGSKADQWILMTVGGDAAMALGMVKVTIENKLHDAGWVTSLVEVKTS